MEAPAVRGPPRTVVGDRRTRGSDLRKGRGGLPDDPIGSPGAASPHFRGFRTVARGLPRGVGPLSRPVWTPRDLPPAVWRLGTPVRVPGRSCPGLAGAFPRALGGSGGGAGGPAGRGAGAGGGAG